MSEIWWCTMLCFAQIQKLLVRLVACVPEGAAQNNEIILQSCILVSCHALKSEHIHPCTRARICGQYQRAGSYHA